MRHRGHVEEVNRETHVNCEMQKTARRSHLRLVGAGALAGSGSGTTVGVRDLVRKRQ